MIEVPYHPKHTENAERCGAAYPCVICGKAVTTPNPWMVHLHGGGGYIVTEEEAGTMPEAEDLGLYPIGAECLRQHPEVKPYAARRPCICHS